MFINLKTSSRKSSYPCIRRLYSIGALRRSCNLPGRVVSDVETPVRMQSSITLHMRISYIEESARRTTIAVQDTCFVVNVIVCEAEGDFVIVHDLRDGHLYVKRRVNDDLHLSRIELHIHCAFSSTRGDCFLTQTDKEGVPLLERGFRLMLMIVCDHVEHPKGCEIDEGGRHVPSFCQRLCNRGSRPLRKFINACETD
jgi:hypothetical protein